MNRKERRRQARLHRKLQLSTEERTTNIQPNDFNTSDFIAGFKMGFDKGYDDGAALYEAYIEPVDKIQSDFRAVAIALSTVLLNIHREDQLRHLLNGLVGDLETVLGEADRENRRWFQDFGLTPIELVRYQELREAIADYLSGKYQTTEHILALWGKWKKDPEPMNKLIKELYLKYKPGPMTWDKTYRLDEIISDIETNSKSKLKNDEIGAKAIRYLQVKQEREGLSHIEIELLDTLTHSRNLANYISQAKRRRNSKGLKLIKV